MSSNSSILFNVCPRGVATLTLNRPDHLNAFDRSMLEGILARIIALAADQAVRIVVLRAAGRHFSAGADMSAPSGAPSAVRHEAFIDLFEAIDALAKPTIAVVQGACTGGSAAIVACCDAVVASENAFFSIPQVRAGVAPVGVSPILIRAMGLRSYRRYALSGERIPAADAVQLGLADIVVPPETLEQRLDDLVDAFLLGAPGAQAEIKAYLRRTYPEMAQRLAEARAHHARIDTFASTEALEGVAAFKASRKPSWYPPRSG